MPTSRPAAPSPISASSWDKARSFSIPGPATMRSRAYMHETTQGIYDALLSGRFAFDFVHEDRLDPERLSKISRAAAAEYCHA